MGHKKICLKCRVVFNRDFDDGSTKQKYQCPSCRSEMILLPHRFRPPKKSEEHKWKTIEYLLDKGFRYEHTYFAVPENLRDAKVFWERIQKINQKLKD